MNRKEFLMLATATTASTLTSARTPASGPVVPPKIVRAGEGTPHAVLGTEMVHKLTGADTYGQLMWLEDHNAAGAMIPPHVHTREDEVFRVLEGQVEFTIGEETVTLGPGDVAFAPRYVPHSWRVVGAGPARTVMIAVPAGIEHMFAELGGLPVGPPDLKRVAEICGRYGISFL